MHAWLLIHRDRHYDRHALFDSFEAAGQEIGEIVLNRMVVELHKDEQELVRRYLKAGEFQEVIELWNEYTSESFDLEEHEIQGNFDMAERRSVHAVLMSLAHQVLLENVVELKVSWQVGRPIKCDRVTLPRQYAPHENFQLDLPLAGKGFNVS